MVSENNTKHLLYRVVNNVNGKEYIGIHSTSNSNDGYLGSGVAILRAVEKYGKHNFTKTVLCAFSDRESLLDGEAVVVDEEYVKRKDTYNLTIGGSAPPIIYGQTHMVGNKNCLGRKLSDETKEKIRKKATERTVSIETRRKMSKSRTGLKRSKEFCESLVGNTRSLGFKHTAETRKKMSDSRVGLKHSEETKKKISGSNTGSKQAVVSCPHCDKRGGVRGMKRYHFDNCKNKTQPMVGASS